MLFLVSPTLGSMQDLCTDVCVCRTPVSFLKESRFRVPSFGRFKRGCGHYATRPDPDRCRLALLVRTISPRASAASPPTQPTAVPRPTSVHRPDRPNTSYLSCLAARPTTRASGSGASRMLAGEAISTTSRTADCSLAAAGGTTASVTAADLPGSGGSPPAKPDDQQDDGSGSHRRAQVTRSERRRDQGAGRMVWLGTLDVRKPGLRGSPLTGGRPELGLI